MGLTTELGEAIRRTQELFKTRGHALDWSSNIMEGSTGLKTYEDWSRYYTWLNNPDEFDPNAEVKPMAEVEEQPDLTPPPEFDVITHQNGTETLIEYKRKKGLSVCDEEKVMETDT